MSEWSIQSLTGEKRKRTAAKKRRRGFIHFQKNYPTDKTAEPNSTMSIKIDTAR